MRIDPRERHEVLLSSERGLWAEGIRMIGGVDEAGAGPLAGPVMAACVVLDPNKTDDLIGVNDSKKLTAKKREELAVRIRTHAAAYAVTSSSVEEIDEINILQATLLAMKRAVASVEAALGPGALGHLLIDARALEARRDLPQTSLIKGDSLSLSIAAASILAKVARDELMIEASQHYPQYGFAAHKGYGTKAHLDALKAHGVTPLHRRSFAPVRDLL